MPYVIVPRRPLFYVLMTHVPPPSSQTVVGATTSKTHERKGPFAVAVGGTVRVKYPPDVKLVMQYLLAEGQPAIVGFGRGETGQIKTMVIERTYDCSTGPRDGRRVEGCV